MGVHDLWPILDPVGNELPLTDLTGKKVAVDLGGWVVQSKMCKALKTTWKPHLKNIFYRVSFLLKNGILPVFVVDGQAPELKRNAILERNMTNSGKQNKKVESKDEVCSRVKFEQILKECQDMLICLGVPCVKSSGEAEAYCALLNKKGIVDGCISNDNDAFLYGAEVVYRDFTIDQKGPQIKRYALDDIKNKLKLDQRKLVALALLLGCDYVGGVPSIGKETALKFLEEQKYKDVLERFQEWKEKCESELFPSYNAALDVRYISHCDKCGHPGTLLKHQKNGCDICGSDNSCNSKTSGDVCSCPWHENNNVKNRIKNELKIYQAVKKMDEFPNLKVVKEYLNYSDDTPDEKCFVWAQPDLLSFQVGIVDWIRWTVAEALEKMLPVITAWQITELRKKQNICKKDFLFYPGRITKPRKRKGEDLYEVNWKSNDERHKSVKLCTLEKVDLFAEAYPDVTEKFVEGIRSKKEKKKRKGFRKAKSSSAKKGACNSNDHPSDETTKNHRIVEFFHPVTESSGIKSEVQPDSEQDASVSSTGKRPAEGTLPGGSAKLRHLEVVQSESEHLD